MSDVTTAGVVGDMVDAVKRGAGKLRDDAEQAIDRMRERYAAAQRARALRLAAIVAAGYYLFRRKR